MGCGAIYLELGLVAIASKLPDACQLGLLGIMRSFLNPWHLGAKASELLVPAHPKRLSLYSPPVYGDSGLELILEIQLQ